MHKKNGGFGERDGWDCLLWEKEVTTDGVIVTHKCYYLKHRAKGHVITSQHKAWNDTIRMMMYVDIILNPIKVRDAELLLWMDNCGPHKTTEVSDLFTKHKIDISLLPPNMTDVLQVLDLCVNGPLKRHTRTLRANRIVDYFKKFKLTFDTQAKRTGELPVFKPPKPQMLQSIQDLIDLLDNEFSMLTFKDGVKRCFQKVGMTKCSNEEFKTYEAAKIAGGVMKIEPTGALHESSYLPPNGPVEDVAGNAVTIVQNLIDDSNAVAQHSIVENAVNAYLDDDDNDSHDSEFDGDSDENSESLDEEDDNDENGDDDF